MLPGYSLHLLIKHDVMAIVAAVKYFVTTTAVASGIIITVKSTIIDYVNYADPEVMINASITIAATAAVIVSSTARNS